jgi:hypothetical protein
MPPKFDPSEVLEVSLAAFNYLDALLEHSNSL